MRIIEQLVYKITGDNSEFDKSIDKSETKVSKFGSVADKMLAGVTVAAIGMVIKKAVEMGNKLVNIASEAQETANKFNVTFSDIREQADNTAKNLSDNFGLSSQKAQQLLSDTGDLLVGFGFTQESALDLSNQVNELAVDLASFTNYSGGAEGASAALTKALLGERESVKSLGISITEADIKQLAEDKGIVGELTRQQKAMLTLEIAVSQSKNAIGDFARSSQEYANQSRILEGNLQDLRVEMGKKLLPIATQIKSAFVELTGKLLGQDSASGKLKTSYENLKTAAQNYNTVLEDSKGKTDAITQATIEQAEAARGVALALLGSEYDDAKEKSARYEKTIANLSKAMENESIATKSYTDTLGISLDELANSSLTEQTITGKLLESGKFSNNQIMSFLETLRNYKDQQDAITEANKDKIESDAKVLQFVNQLTVGYLNNDDAAKLLLATYPELQQKVLDNVEAYKKEQKATEDAAEAFKAYENATSEEISNAIKQLSLEEKTLMNEKLIELLQKRKIELAGEAAKAADDLAGKEKARNEIIEAGNKAMQSAEQYALALGDSYDLNAQKASILETTIKALIDSGLTAESEAVKNLVAQLESLGGATEETSSTATTAFSAMTKATSDAYKEMARGSMSQKDIAMANIQAQADKFLEAGVSIVDVATWQKNELGKLQEEQTKKAKEEAEKVRKAWEDATFSMLGSVTSIWGSINQVQANANDEEIQRIEEQNATAIQAAKDRGASEEEVTELEESLQADLNDTKNKYAQEEAERNKALSTLSVILDTAKAIMQIWANPLIDPWGKGLWTGLAAGAGAAQIAAINSAPVPSYDVGSIRIPETTTATVHKDEMILTAPQAEQARREGITIAPTKNGGNSVNLVIYLDGREIARNTIDNLNSGSVGTIKARVVK